MRRVLLLAVLWLAFALAPFPRPAKKPVPRPIQAAFAKIYLGMPEEELFQVMAPFKKVQTGHGQWPCWAILGERHHLGRWRSLGEHPGRCPGKGIVQVVKQARDKLG